MTYVLIGLLLGWLGNWSLSVYYHRMCTHRSVTLKGPLLLFVRVYTWLTQFGITAPAWVALHIMHHRYEDTDKDPHSPKILGLWKPFMLRSIGRKYISKNSKAYREGIKRCPRDKMEAFFARHNELGYLIFLLICLLAFDLYGLIVWSITILSTVLGNGIIASTAHETGYRHDKGTSAGNLPFFFGLLAGEEWHNNHHNDPGNPHFKRRWWEIDTGFLLLKFFSYFRLVELDKRTSK